MNKKVKAVVGIIVIAAVLFIPLMTSYNSLVSLDQNVKAQESNINTLLDRRASLIPNLVEVVKGYAAQEKDIISDITNARTKYVGATSLTDKANADTQLTSVLSRLIVVSEAYPDLKSNTNFRDLTVALEGTENRIAIARQDYNKTVDNYNTAVRKFPSSIAARLFRFQQRSYYKPSINAQDVPKVEFKK